MIQRKRKLLISSGLAIVVAALFIFLPDTPKKTYFVNQGQVFGTYYNIRYESERDMESDILARLEAFDASLSMFNDSSTITRINRNEDVKTDSLFEKMYAEAFSVSEVSHGAFDITVAPLVHAWGFGKGKRPALAMDEAAKRHEIDSLLAFTGYEKIALHDHQLKKQDPRTQLDASAIAKGYGCDVIADLLRQEGCENFLVDIGGEVVAHGRNDKNQPWRIGIDKPNDDPTGQDKTLQDIIETEDIAMATSGNYRQFYYEGGERRSHTIDPHTGYPIQHKLLSATITSTSCMRADALATACMVMGEDEGMRMIDNLPDAECYFIIADGDSLIVRTSARWLQKIQPQTK